MEWQRIRLELFGGDKQDIMFAQLLSKGHDLIKEDVIKLTNDPKIDKSAKKDQEKRNRFWKTRI